MILLWFLYVHTCSWYVLLEVRGEVITTINNVNSWDTSCIFTVHWKGTENQRSSKWVFNYDTMSGFIITLICQFTHYSLIVNLLCAHCLAHHLTLLPFIRFIPPIDFLAWIRANFSFFLNDRGDSLHKGQPFLRRVFWVIKYLLSGSLLKLKLQLRIFLYSDHAVI